MRVRFGDWTYDSETRQLYRGSDPVHLSPKAFELLGTLLETRPKALAKAELLARLWPKTFVSEANLASLVAEVRTALGDQARQPRYIRTVHGFGYAFAETEVVEEKSATEEEPPLCLRLIWGEREMALEEGETLLGRSHQADLWIEDESVSRRHARVVVVRGHATVEDLGSKNGTRVRGERIDGPTELADGDEIRLGSVELVLRVYSGALATRTAADG